MEKQELTLDGDHSGGQQQHSRRSSWFKWTALFAFLVGVQWFLRPTKGTWFPLSIHTPSSPETTRCKSFSWSDITAKKHLDFHTCYDGEFKCAKLELPMDYWNGTTNATVSVAVIKKPAVVPVTHPQYGGVTLHNPGGPGGSGVSFLRFAASGLRSIIDSYDGTGKFFDHLSFDPRGIGFTTPRVSCFQAYWNDLFWAIRLNEQGAFSASDAAFGRLWAMDKARWASCSLPVEEGEIDVKKYVSTASVARDMLEIVERHGEWREKEARRHLEHESRCGGSVTEDDKIEILEAVKYKPGEEKLNYWGFSYGSYLGNTFAAMFPRNINRLIVDGVVDAYDYKKALWLDNLVDTERALGLFYYHCARVGFPTCVLANETGSTTEEGVKQRVENVTNSLYHNPLPIISKSDPEVVTYSNVRNVMFAVLYTPIGGFEVLADILRNIELGRGDYVNQRLQNFSPGHRAVLDADEYDGPDIMGDAQTAIACGDGDSQSWMTKADFADHIHNITKISPLSEMWSTLRLKCIHYTVRPHARFEGPWVANTSHPILEIGNSADPVTPGRYAVKMAKGFEGAVALLQNSGGHCSISAPSTCTQFYVNQYFQTGDLPADGTVCEPDVLPFGPTPKDGVLEYESGSLDPQLEIAAAMQASGGGFQGGGLRAGMYGSLQ